MECVRTFRSAENISQMSGLPCGREMLFLRLAQTRPRGPEWRQGQSLRGRSLSPAPSLRPPCHTKPRRQGGALGHQGQGEGLGLGPGNHGVGSELGRGWAAGAGQEGEMTWPEGLLATGRWGG